MIGVVEVPTTTLLSIVRRAMGSAPLCMHSCASFSTPETFWTSSLLVCLDCVLLRPKPIERVSSCPSHIVTPFCGAPTTTAVLGVASTATAASDAGELMGMLSPAAMALVRMSRICELYACSSGLTSNCCAAVGARSSEVLEGVSLSCCGVARCRITSKLVCATVCAVLLCACVNDRTWLSLDLTCETCGIVVPQLRPDPNPIVVLGVCVQSVLRALLVDEMCK